MSTSSLMKAAIFNEYATTPEFSNVNVIEVEKPKLTKGHALVKIYAAAINPMDTMIQFGHAKGLPFDPKFPATPGFDFAGVIEAVGENEEGLAVGDAVFGCDHGGDYPYTNTFKEYAVFPLLRLAKKPAELSFDLAASLGIVGCTSYQTIENTKVGAGTRVLMFGGSTACGLLGIQLAKLKGAWVAATASTRNVQYVKSLGADKVIDYTVVKWEDDPELKNMDVVISYTNEKDFFVRAKAAGVLKADGVVLSISPLADPQLGDNPAGHPPLTYAANMFAIGSAKEDTIIAELLLSGKLKLPIEEVFEFTTEGVRGILKKSAGGKTVGKNVLRIVT